LLDLPAELLLYIINDIGDVCDLLSLALTNRGFCKLIIPWHIEYRWISSHMEIPNLLRTLSTKPHLAARIQKL
ncbi:hypothetical protein M422DRAFT_97445, partial [Sphaerobolus stellatus SS14]